MVRFFRAMECSQSFSRRSSVIVLRISISFLSWDSVWMWVTHKLLVSSVMLLIWIWAGEKVLNSNIMFNLNFSESCDELPTCKSCIFKWWMLISLLKVWLTAPTVQLTSSSFSLRMLICPDVSLKSKENILLDLSGTFLRFHYTAMFWERRCFRWVERTGAGGLGCGARWRLEPPLHWGLWGSCRRSYLALTTGHPAARGSPLTEGSEPGLSSTPPLDPARIWIFCLEGFCAHNTRVVMSLNHHTEFPPFPVLTFTLMRTSSLCNQSLWFWKRFSSFQMFSSRSAWVDASPGFCWSSREWSDNRVTFSISTSSRFEDTWERETGERNKKRKKREICSKWWLTDPSATAKVPKQSIIYYQSLLLGSSQNFNAEQMLIQLPAYSGVLFLLNVLFC